MVICRNIYLTLGGVLGVLFVNSAQAVEVQSWRQPSGVQVHFVHSPSLPMVDVQVDFDAGERLVPAAQAGLASATASMLSAGVPAVNGQPALNENQLGEAWADLGAGFAAHAGRERFTVQLRSLTDPKLLMPAVTLAARQLGESSFPEPIWQRDRARWQANLREGLTRPGTVAAQAYAKAVFGDHPYGRITTEVTLKAISVADLRRWRDEQLAPCRAKATVVGAVDRELADQLVQQLVSRLPATHSRVCPKALSTPPMPKLAETKRVDIPFKSAQAQVLMGQSGYARSDARHFAFVVGNHILGEGFTSRLMKAVREQRGLSYSVGSGFSVSRDAGSFTISLQTKPEQAALAQQVAQDVLKEFVTKGPTEAEMTAAKANLVGSFALRIDSNAKLLGNVANMAWNELPLDYLNTWTQRIEAVTREDVKQAFSDLIAPDRLAVVMLNGSDAP